MSSDNNGSGCAVLIGILAGLYALYLVTIFLVKAFAYLGYNSFFYMDNLLYIKGANPIVSWGILGLLLGSIIGVLISAKKRHLPKTLVLAPIALTLVFLITMGFINKPGNYSESFVFPSEEAETAPAITYYYYSVKSDVNVRSGPSVNNDVLFTLKKGYEVVVLERNFYDAKNKEWMKISYGSQQGYVSSRFLEYSRSYP